MGFSYYYPPEHPVFASGQYRVRFETPEGEEVYVQGDDDQEHLSPSAKVTAHEHFCGGCSLWFVEHWRQTVNSAGIYFCPTCADEARRACETVQPGRDTGERTFPGIKIEVPAMYALAELSVLPAKHRGAIERWPFKVPFLGIIGIPGSGKTHCCWAVARGMANRGRYVETMAAPDLRQRWLDKKRLPEGSMRFEERLFRAPWLILDDLSAATGTDGWAEFAHNLLDRRTSNMLPTLLTSAASGEELERLYDRAFRSRLQFFEWVCLPDKDWRMKEHRWRKDVGEKVEGHGERADAVEGAQHQATLGLADLQRVEGR